MDDPVIGVLDQARARLIAHAASAPEGKTLWGFHMPVPHVVRDSRYWHLPAGTRIVRKYTDHRNPAQRAHDLEVGKRVLQSGDDDLMRRWLNGESVEHLVH